MNSLSLSGLGSIKLSPLKCSCSLTVGCSLIPFCWDRVLGLSTGWSFAMYGLRCYENIEKRDGGKRWPKRWPKQMAFFDDPWDNPWDDTRDHPRWSSKVTISRYNVLWIIQDTIIFERLLWWPRKTLNNSPLLFPLHFAFLYPLFKGLFTLALCFNSVVLRHLYSPYHDDKCLNLENSQSEFWKSDWSL